MLVHPSQRNLDHERYHYWVSQITNRWVKALLGSPVDRKDALAELRPGYDELSRTDMDLPPFEELADALAVAMTRVAITQVNANDEGLEIDWDNSADHILIGGEKLNRGFTVEGLTVTYMPRDVGGWNADTIQQRARFFGYKQKYLSLCRLYLHPAVTEAFTSYVRHEEDIRTQLAVHRGKPLSDWRRAFFLDARMSPTRRGVLSDPYYKVPKKDVWFLQRYPHNANHQANASLFAAVEGSLALKKHKPSFFQHSFASMPLKDLYEKLLYPYSVRGNDVADWYGQLVTIGDLVNTDPTAEALVVVMMADENKRNRDRKPSKGAITLHQGASSKKNDPKSYQGDRDMVSSKEVTVQLHLLNVTGGLKGVPALAVHIPEALKKDDVGVQVPDKAL